MKNLRTYLPIISIFGLALLVRIIYNLTVARHYIPEIDAVLYHTLAKNLVTYHCFCYIPHRLTTSRSPLWPFIMSVIYFITGPTNFYARLFLSFLGSATCVLVYLFAKDIFGKRIALITGVIAAIYPGLFIYDGWLYLESLYTFLMVAFTYSLYRLQRNAQWQWITSDNIFLVILLYWLQRASRRRWMILSGVLLGLAVLARPNGEFLIILLFAWALVILLAKMVPWQTIIKCTLIILCIAAMLIAPWTLRNYKVTHTFILVAALGGNVLSGVYNDTALKEGGIWEPLEKIRPKIDFHGHSCCDYTGEADHINYALHWISTHISSMPYLLSLHFINMWKPYTGEAGFPFEEFPTRISSQIVLNMIPIMYVPIFLLAAFGLLVTWKRWKKHLFVVYLVIALNIIQNVAFYGSSRFRAPIEPLLVLLAGGAIWWLTCNEPGTRRYIFRKKVKREGLQVTSPKKATPMIAEDTASKGDY
jgi:4-amino-4-deoxy-L-arabinose transferase-like glycosyltransferase